MKFNQQSSKRMEELKEKLSEEQTNKIQTSLDKLKEVDNNEDYDSMKESMEKLQSIFQEISTEIYQQQTPTEESDEQPKDVDYEEVD